MISKIPNRINSLTLNANILIVGQLEEKLKLMIDNYLKNKEYLDFTDDSIDILNSALYGKFDVIIFVLDKKSYELFDKNMILIPENAIFIINEEVYLNFKSKINLIYSLLINPISEELLLNKIYGLLTIKETNNLFKTKEKIVNKYQNSIVNSDIDNFLDLYSGNIMFINDDLNEKLVLLKDFEISKELFSKIILNLIQLADILNENKNLEHLSNLFFEFSKFLDSIDLQQINPSKYESFDYLTNIIEDITLYLDELFVYRLFKDSKIFEDSLENNIEYFKAKLLEDNKKDDIDNLEFFND